MSTATPVRSCAVCRTRAPQSTLIRVVRAADGTIRVDRSAHRAAGRGAYLCHAERCLQKAPRALGRALKVTVPAEFEHELREAVQKGKGETSMS
ncbi:MAG: YlxR family protein [Armatimonadota bacterium]